MGDRIMTGISHHPQKYRNKEICDSENLLIPLPPHLLLLHPLHIFLSHF